jgi:hypothetical protein
MLYLIILKGIGLLEGIKMWMNNISSNVRGFEL